MMQLKLKKVGLIIINRDLIILTLATIAGFICVVIATFLPKLYILIEIYGLLVGLYFFTSLYIVIFHGVWLEQTEKMDKQLN